MKLQVKHSTITALNNLKGLWLLKGKDIVIIKDFQYVQEKPEPPAEPVKSTFFQRKSKVKKFDDTPKIYLTSITIEGYHPDLKFVGTYNEEYCANLIEQHESLHYNFDLIELRKAWTHLKEQIDAFHEHENK